MVVAPTVDADRLGARQFVVRRHTGKVGLDHEHRRGVAVEAERVDIVDGTDREAVHQLQGHGRQARGGDPGDGVARGFERREEREQGPASRRRGAKTERRFGDKPERSL